MSARSVRLKPQAHSRAATHQEASFISLLRFEYVKASKRRMFRVVFGLMAFAMGAIHFGGYLLIMVFGVGDPGELAAYLPPSIIGDMFSIMSILGPILMVILAAGIVGSEYAWGTIRTVVGTGVNRGKLLAAKLIVLVAASVALTLTGLAVVISASLVISLIEGQGLGLDWISMSRLGELLLMVARNSFVISVIGILLGFMPAQLARSVTAGIGAGIGALVVSPLLHLLTGSLGSIGEQVDDFLLPNLGEALDRLNTFRALDETAGIPDPWQAAGTLALYAAIAITVSVVDVRRRDIAVD